MQLNVAKCQVHFFFVFHFCHQRNVSYIGWFSEHLVMVLFWHLRSQLGCFNPADRTRLFLIECLFECPLKICCDIWLESKWACAWLMAGSGPWDAVCALEAMCTCTCVSSTCRWKQQAAVQITACHQPLSRAWSCILPVYLMALTSHWPPVIFKLCKWGIWGRMGESFEE